MVSQSRVLPKAKAQASLKTSSTTLRFISIEVLTLAWIMVRVVMQYFIKALGINRLCKCVMQVLKIKSNLFLHGLGLLCSSL